MTAVPGPAFRDHLAAIDRETVTAFAAAVYEARGWTVTRDDGTLLVTPPRSERARRVVVGGGAATGDGEADGDEATDGDGASAEDRTVVDAARLHEMVAYALPPAERTRLCQQFFDRDPAAFGRGEDGDERSSAATARGDDGNREAGAPRPTTGRERGVDATDRVSGRAGDAGRKETDRSADDGREKAGQWADDRPEETNRSAADQPDRSGWLARAAVVGVVVSLALGGIVTATGPGGVDVESAAAAVLGGEETTEEARSPRAYPRGVSETGVTDAAALADAHEATLSNRSYRLTITYREFEDGELRGVAHERAVVASPNRYRSRVQRFGTLKHDSTLIASGPAYANGSTGYIRTADGVRERTEIRSSLATTSADSVGFLDRTERTVQWYLSTNDSRIVGSTDHNGTAVYRMAFEGDPWPESRNVTGWARVDEDGMVRTLHREYTPTIESSVRIEVTVRIEPGPVTVTRPAWLPATTNGSYDRPAPQVTLDSRSGAADAAPTARPNV